MKNRGDMIRENDGRQIQRTDYLLKVIGVLPYSAFDLWRARELMIPDVNYGSNAEGTKIIWHFGSNRTPADSELIEVIWRTV